jgi:hypothetical protein
MGKLGCNERGQIVREPARAMRTNYSITVEIQAAPAVVWRVMTEVERWPEWTPSICRLKRASPGPLQVGTRVRIHQPRLPPAWWSVTELIPGSDFAWVSRGPGLRVTARHGIMPIETGARVTLSIDYEGLLGGLLARWIGELNERYLAMEANGLKSRCTDLSAAQRPHHVEPQ